MLRGGRVQQLRLLVIGRTDRVNNLSVVTQVEYSGRLTTFAIADRPLGSHCWPSSIGFVLLDT
eukprot:5599576-Pyramimonas_sp.AAC.1